MVAASKTTLPLDYISNIVKRGDAILNVLNTYGNSNQKKISPAASADSRGHVLHDTGLRTTITATEISVAITAHVLSIKVAEEWLGRASRSYGRRTGWKGSESQGHDGSRERMARQA